MRVPVWVRGLLALWAILFGLSSAHAGGGAENVFLLVNENSPSSKTIANHYIALRKLPDSNVLYLDWQGDVEKTDANTFRERILSPALAAIQNRGLSEQIDYLVYSSDFPWQVDVKGDLAGQKTPPQLSPLASLTGVTYLWRAVAARNPNVVGLRNNLYAQHLQGADKITKSFGFHAWYGWSEQGEPLEAGGTTYLLSTMLGVTSGRGNTVEEVISYLTRSAEADGSHPRGTIYYMKNSNVRSTTREPGFEPAVKELKELGIAAEIVSGTIPSDKSDVQGLMVGTSDFDWAKSGSKIQPGALCEHLTSFGGVLRKNAGQTPLTEFLKYGAAGATGTVTEPYAIQDKFPLPAVQVHYARGCSLAEACYQSVAGPYQLLIVGDPLCQPWAKIPLVLVQGIEAGETIKGKVEFLPQIRPVPGMQINHYELFVDGHRTARVPPGQKFVLDTVNMADGYHELRVVAISAGPIAAQGRTIIPVTVSNQDQELTLTGPAQKSVGVKEKISLEVQARGATAIAIMHCGRAIGRVTGDEGRVEIDAEQLGSGPVELQAVALGGPAVKSAPLRFSVELP